MLMLTKNILMEINNPLLEIKIGSQREKKDSEWAAMCGIGSGGTVWKAELDLYSCNLPSFLSTLHK